MFENLPIQTPAEIKKIIVGATLAAAMAVAGRKRSEVATALGWKPGQITRLLSGDANPTLETLVNYCRELGYDVSMTLHPIGTPAPLQPWELPEHDDTQVRSPTT